MSGIDHNERKERIARVAATIIAREGMEAATVRRIAAEVGFSTTIITHYFADKRELLLWAYRFIGNQAILRLDQLLAHSPGDLVGSLVALTPTDEEMRRGWGVYVAFWEMAKLDPVFAEEQRLWIGQTSARIGAIIRASSGDRKDITVVAQTLVALVYGISVQALFDPQSWSPEQVKTTFAKAVEMVLGGTGR